MKKARILNLELERRDIIAISIAVPSAIIVAVVSMVLSGAWAYFFG